jgi:hypothetical protein
MPTTFVPLTNLEYETVDLQDYPRVFLQLIEGGPDWTPEVRGEDRIVPYRSGRVYAPRRNDRLPILLKGWVAGSGANEATRKSDTAAARAALRTLFDPTAGLGTLTVTTEDGTDWTIEAYPESVVWEAEPAVPTFWPVMVRLVAIGDATTGAFWTEVAGS